MATNANHQPNQFTTDEYVLAYHGPLLYEARVSDTTSPWCPSCFGCRWMAATCWMHGAILTYTRLVIHPPPPHFNLQILLAENWNESNTLLGSTGPHYFIHYKGWKQT